MNEYFDKKLELEFYYLFLKERYRKSPLKFLFVCIIIILYIAIPSFNIPALEITRTRISGVMEQRALENFLLFYPEQDWIAYDEIPIQFKQAALVMEDDGFAYHRGIDWESLQLASRINFKRGKIVRGGSTITMQTAKNIYFSTHRSYFRKAKEILTAIRMEKELSKQKILEHYLNIVELGNGIFGISAAAQKFFGKEVDQLNRDQIARIIAILPSPLKHKPNDNSRFVIRRKNLALSRISSAILPE
ncbi:MAG: biosynthetic peptidoglycan transglycosylase [Ignavibacteria bacterium]